MTKRKAKTRAATESTAPVPSKIKSNAATGKLVSYISVVGVQTTLLAFAAFFLPRWPFLVDIIAPEIDESQLSSRDRPQLAFFDALTRNPTFTMVLICSGLAVIQGWWGGYIRSWWIDAFTTGTSDEVKAKKQVVDQRKLNNLSMAWLATLLATIPFHLTLVLFGAHLTSHVLKTFTLSILLSLLLIFPAAYTLGIPTLSNDLKAFSARTAWIGLFAELEIGNALQRALVYPLLGTLAGCWVGVIPIALDWDRPWQAWPLTPAYGAILGYIISSLSAATVSTVTTDWPDSPAY